MFALGNETEALRKSEGNLRLLVTD